MYACLYRPPALDAYSAYGHAELPGSPTRQPRWGGHSEASARGSLEPLRSAQARIDKGGAPRGVRDNRRARGDRRELFVQDSASSAVSALNVVALAADFSPRYERHRDDLVSIDVSGLGRLLGPMRAIGEELRREAAARGLRVHVALAGTRMAALVLVHARPGLTLVEPGEEAEALAPLPIGILEKIAPEAESLRSRPRECEALPARAPGGAPARVNRSGAPREVSNVIALLELPELAVCRSWGLNTLGELAAL